MSDQLETLFEQARGGRSAASGADPLDATWNKPTAANDADPLDSVWQDDAGTRAGVSLTIKRDANPDRAGEANRLARETGLPGDTAENNLDEIKAKRQQETNTALARGNPKLAQWASNTRNAAVAQDDMGTLATIGHSLLRFPSSIGAGFYDISAGLWGMGRAAAENVPFSGLNPALTAKLPLQGYSNPVSRMFAKVSAGAQDMANRLAPVTGNFASDAFFSGVRSLPTTGVAVAASMAGAPSAGLALFGATQGGQSYMQARGKGLRPDSSLAYGTVQGGIEAGTEALPMSYLVKTLGKARLPQFLAHFIGRELGSEEVSTLSQNAVQWATLNPEKPLSAFLAEQPAALLQTAIGTAAVGGAAGGLHLAVSAVNSANDQKQAVASAEHVDGIMAAAANSKVRERDPVAFREFVAAHTDGTPAENLYVPGAKVRELLQSDRFDPNDPGHAWLSGYGDQANEAAALGGDVVIPVADAATHLAGTKAWDAIKDDARLNPGGMSATEAKTAEDHFAADLESRGSELARQAAADEAAAAPSQAVYEDVRDRLMHARQTPDVADKLAQLYAAHATAVGAQLGTDAAAYHSANPVEFRQVLPPALARVQAVDGLDMVINALKRGAEKQTDAQKFGPSLLDFIAKRGGIEDRGGDIAAMGAANWHREKPFRKRLLKPVGADQSLPGMEPRGETPNSPDSLALAAWEAGYFPGEAARPDLRTFYDAIEGELRGTPRYASDSVTEHQQLADAADELRQILDATGLDASKASRANIREALQRYSQQQAEGRSLEQPAYHGSPHIFDRFSLDKIGTGEGAQAYGHGLYFAGKKAIAEFYREKLSRGHRLRPEVLAEYYTPGRIIRSWGGHDKVIAFHPGPENAPWDWSVDVQEVDTEGNPLPGSRSRNHTTQPDIKNVEAALGKRAAGRLYHVEIPEDNEFLLWDKRIREQPAKIREALAKVGVDIPGAADISRLDAINAEMAEMAKERDPVTNQMLREKEWLGLAKERDVLDAKMRLTGKEIYRQVQDDVLRGTGAQMEAAKTINGKILPYDQLPLARQAIFDKAAAARQRTDKSASELLHDAGIAGIKYLDNSSRFAGAGTHNYVVFDDSRVAIRAYEQTYADGVRGRATFGTGKPIIEMFTAADLSTMIHETGHVWLEEFKVNAEASPEIAADWQTVKDWFAANGHAVGEDGVIPTEAHELWARGFERFAMEGKAPSSALRRAFDAFRAWLLHIYKVVDNLRAPITPEIRDVMNRMLATQEEIDAAEEAQNLKALFTDAAQAGMTEEEFAAYEASTQEARGEAYDALIYRTMQSIRQQRTKAWKEEEATVRADVTARINQRPEFKALHLLRTGKWLGEPEREGVKVRLDRQWLVDSYGNDALAMLPKGVPPIYGEKGTDADAIAEMVGFPTGDEMVRTLMGIEAAQKDLRDAGDKRSVRNRLIDEEAAAEMRDRHGDPLNDGSIEEEALVAVHNDRQGELIASEARALTRRTGGAPTPYKLAREWAARKTAEGKVVDVASRAALHRYAKAAAKAGKAAEAAILKGDVDETFRQKQAQLLNHALLVEAKKAADDVDAAVARLSKIARRATMKAVDQDYLDRAHALLEQFDFRPRPQKGLDEQEGFSAWAAGQRANGVDIVMPPRLEANGEHYSRISVEELRGLKDSVDQLIHLGRLKQKLLDAKEQRDFDEVVDEAVNSVGQLPPRTPSDNMTPSGWERFKTRIASADAALLKMETIVDRLDNGNPNGVFNRLVFRPLADAQARSRAMMAEKIAAFQDLIKLVPKQQLKRWSQRVVVPELINKETGRPFNMTRDRLIQMALNMGNAGNADKLARGYGWDEATVMRVLDRELTKEEWQHVQAELDLVGSLWPKIAAMYKRLNGVEPEKIEARPIETRHGTFAGGYFPVIYDSTKDATAEAQAAAAGDQLFENIYTRATTSNGFTEKRTNVARPINLAYGLTSRHLAEVIHDLTHREAVINADKFLSDKRIVRAVRSTMGPEVQKQFRPWLQHVANEMALDKRGLAGWEGFAKKLRTNTSIMGMGYRLTVILSQVAGYTNSAEQIGTRWLASGFKQASNPKNWAGVIERSAEVRARMETLDRDIQDNIKGLVGDHSPVAQVKRFAFTGIGWMDRVVVIPTWLGAYGKAQSEGMSDEDAIYYADKIVRNSQGANAAKDLAAVQRGSEFWKLASMFYSYASAFVNRQHALAWDTGDAVRQGKVRAAPELVARSFWLFAAAPLMQALITGHGPGEDDDWGSWAFWNMFSNFFMGVPVLRDVTGALSSGYGYSYTPVERMIGTVFKLSKDAKHVLQGDDAPQVVRHGIEAAGYSLGLPLGQAASAAQFAVDVANGDQQPETVGDWYRGITTGKAEQRPTFR